MTDDATEGRLAAILSGALDPNVDLATTLRQCLALGTDTGSERLRAWASQELKGYGPEVELPKYRVTHAMLYMDGISGGRPVSRQPVPTTLLPEVARDLPDHDIELRESLATLIQHLGDARQTDDGAIFIAPPRVDLIITLMNSTLATARQNGTGGITPDRQMIQRVYWAVPFATFTGVADSVRTILVELVSEIRAGLSGGASVPTRELADRAVNVAVYGDHNHVVLSHAEQGGTSVVGGTIASGGSPRDGRAKTIAWWVFGVVATVCAIVALVHH